MRHFQRWIVIGVMVVAVGSARGALAQGYGLNEQGACAMGRGGTGVAAPCPDGSSIFFNPAGIAFISGQQLGIGASLVAPRGDFTDTTTGQVSTLNSKSYPLPNVYYAGAVGKRFAVGFGVNAPYGLTTDWPITSQGRFLGYKSLVQGLYMQPTVAARLNDRVAVGVGVDIVYLKVQLRQRIDLSTQKLTGTPYTFAQYFGVPAGTDFADVDLEGHDWNVGYHLGVQIRATDKVSFGARYLSGQKVDVPNGVLTTAQVATGLTTTKPLPGIPVGTPMDMVLTRQFASGAVLESGQSGSTTLPLPAQFAVGTALQVAPRLKLLFDYRFVQWSAFDQLVIEKENSTQPTVTVESYRNAHAFHFGGDISVTPRFDLRAGFFATTAAAPDQTVTPNLPEGSRQNYSVGFGAKLTKSVRVDFAYQYLRQGERAGRTTDGGMAVPTTAVNNGVYRFHANLLGLMLGFGF
jgi:long-chain fatty acid transport protein